jgi:hypothetical protein
LDGRESVGVPAGGLLGDCVFPGECDLYRLDLGARWRVQRSGDGHRTSDDAHPIGRDLGALRGGGECGTCVSERWPGHMCHVPVRISQAGTAGSFTGARRVLTLHWSDGLLVAGTREDNGSAVQRGLAVPAC